MPETATTGCLLQHHTEQHYPPNSHLLDLTGSLASLLLFLATLLGSRRSPRTQSSPRYYGPENIKKERTPQRRRTCESGQSRPVWPVARVNCKDECKKRVYCSAKSSIKTRPFT